LTHKSHQAAKVERAFAAEQSMVHGVFEERPDHIVGGIDELDAEDHLGR